jgi:hypothetical protein
MAVLYGYWQVPQPSLQPTALPSLPTIGRYGILRISEILYTTSSRFHHHLSRQPPALAGSIFYRYAILYTLISGLYDNIHRVIISEGFHVQHVKGLGYPNLYMLDMASNYIHGLFVCFHCSWTCGAFHYHRWTKSTTATTILKSRTGSSTRILDQYG